MRTSLLLLCSAVSMAVAESPSPFPPPKSLGDVSTYGRNVQRTMRLLTTSTPEDRHTVRVLFYGQSITEQRWWKIVADDLRTRFPNADLVIENRALGGHSSQLLVKTAEADLYPFQPDLLIFHVYGAHDKYEEIIRRVRERTCAEILQQNDHVTKPADLTEETDPAKLAPNKGGWDAFMNHQFLPGVAQKYGTEFCDQRAIWKRYLTDYNLEPKALLKDAVHLNAHGEFLMAEAVKTHLRYDPQLGPSPAEAWVKTYAIGKDVPLTDGRVVFEFTGNRVDLIASGEGSAEVSIDGKKPSEFSELYGFNRVSGYPGSNWPILLKVGSEKPLQVEDWTLTFKNTSGDLKAMQFELSGAKTGPDGASEVGQRFVSNSGRIVIEPDDWNLAFCLKVFGPRLKDGDTAKWKVIPRFLDTAAFTASKDPAIENALTVAQGLPNTKHTLEVSGDLTHLVAIRVYTPPLK
jgi:hypothetical protein